MRNCQLSSKVVISVFHQQHMKFPIMPILTKTWYCQLSMNPNIDTVKVKKGFLGGLRNYSSGDTKVQITFNQCSKEGRRSGSLYGLLNVEKEPGWSIENKENGCAHSTRVWQPLDVHLQPLGTGLLSSQLFRSFQMLGGKVLRKPSSHFRQQLESHFKSCFHDDFLMSFWEAF